MSVRSRENPLVPDENEVTFVVNIPRIRSVPRSK